MKILICGGRDYDNYEKILEKIKEVNPSCIIEGGASGADALAKKAAIELNIKYEEYPADWKRFGRSAGPKRNQLMLDDNEDIELVLAFHPDLESSKGTKDMVKRAKKKNIEVKVFE